LVALFMYTSVYEVRIAIVSYSALAHVCNLCLSPLLVIAAAAAVVFRWWTFGRCLARTLSRWKTTAPRPKSLRKTRTHLLKRCCGPKGERDESCHLVY